MANFGPRETSPNISVGLPTERDILTRRYDLVEQMQFLYVRVVRARDLPPCAPYVEVRLGNYKGTIDRFFQRTSFPVWNQVFAFEKDRIQDLNLEVVVRDRMVTPHAIVGRVRFLVPDAPKRVPPESPLAPQWYKLEDQNGTLLVSGDVMLAVWMGTQADEFFPQAWLSNSTSISIDTVAYTYSKVYILPTLWYLRVNVIQAQDLLLRFHPESSDLFVQVDLGRLRLRTSFSKKKNPNPLWNEDLMFVAQEPFKESLVISVEQGTLADHVSLGKCVIPLKNVDKRLDGGGVASRWYNLDKPGPSVIDPSQEVVFASKFNARISLDGAYHVLDEHTEYCSDFRASAKKLWRPSIGVLELGLLKASGLEPMNMGARTHAYCVAKYGPKWVRTRTIVDSLSPVWNEQYMWEVYDPYTVITIAVFHNNQLDAENRARGAMDTLMGKIRIRLSMLERSKIYTHSYPLICLQPSGVKNMGEIHLALRFSWPFWSFLNVHQFYILPLFPRHHYIFPLSPTQIDNLRNQAAHVTSLRLSSAEPPLHREVVFDMLDVRSAMWSMRKGQATLRRIKNLMGGFVSLWKWLEDVRYWKNPLTTFLFYLLCILVLLFPKPLLPLGIFYPFSLGLKCYFKRPKHPPYIDAELSCLDAASPDDLEEEFDMFPSQFEGERLRRRYDRLRAVGGTAQRMANEVATMGERLQSLRSWRDPRATTLFLMFCCVSYIVTIIFPARFIIFLWITFYLRHPRFRSVLPSIPQNFLMRMPSKRTLIL
ncbi:FT-interacting protein 3-like [Neltuma alba]|uniref:FT-interacting protein 3-like n=1 Tax=Neltuma alba TaxID=207710 RepID=UPI0010A47116|nr:FT-interacting protein 3-like [Prosopis alba]